MYRHTISFTGNRGLYKCLFIVLVGYLGLFRVHEILYLKQCFYHGLSAHRLILCVQIVTSYSVRNKSFFNPSW